MIKEAKIETYSFGQHFCQEHRSIVENKLYVLISGMMTVRCDGIFLQALQPLEFINSIEWKCGQYGQPFSTYQVSIEAITECEVLVFNQDNLEKAFESTPHLQFIIDSLVSRDIAKKLYAVSDISHMGSGGANKNQDHQGNKKNLRSLDFRRTVSMDAIHTGGKGNVRSQDWIHQADLRQFQTGMYLFTYSIFFCMIHISL